jgi:hypothetical protein
MVHQLTHSLHSSGKLELTISNVFVQRTNFRRWLSHFDSTSNMSAFSGILDDALDLAAWTDTSEQEGIQDELDTDRKLEHRYHYRHQGLVYSKERSHAGNSVIAYHYYGKVCYGTIQHINALSSGEVILGVLPYQPLPRNRDDPFSRYASHFPARLLSNRRGNETLLKIADVKCHCARYALSKDEIMLAELSRVRSTSIFSLVDLISFKD